MLTPSFMIICLSPPFVPLRQKYSQASYLALSADSSSIYLSRWTLSSNPQLLCPVFVMHCLYSLPLSIPEKFLVLLLGKQPKLSYFSHPFLSKYAFICLAVSRLSGSKWGFRWVMRGLSLWHSDSPVVEPGLSSHGVWAQLL